MYQLNLLNTSLYILRTHFLGQDLKVAFNPIFEFSYYDQRVNKDAFISKHISQFPNFKTSYGNNNIHNSISYLID